MAGLSGTPSRREQQGAAPGPVRKEVDGRVGRRAARGDDEVTDDHPGAPKRAGGRSQPSAAATVHERTGWPAGQPLQARRSQSGERKRATNQPGRGAPAATSWGALAAPTTAGRAGRTDSRTPRRNIPRESGGAALGGSTPGRGRPVGAGSIPACRVGKGQEHQDCAPARRVRWIGIQSPCVANVVGSSAGRVIRDRSAQMDRSERDGTNQGARAYGLGGAVRSSSSRLTIMPFNQGGSRSAPRNGLLAG